MKIFFSIAILALFLAGCSNDNPVINFDDGKKQELQRMTDSLANYYRIEKNITQGGFLLSINAPGVSYLVSSGIEPQVQPNSHFRLASITKTFTAAAIMLLHQQGKINIYDYITGVMPGSGTTYLPQTEDYNIPFKDGITIEMLLQHRAGVFDVTNSDIPDTINQPYAGMRYVDYITIILGQKNHTFTFDEMIGVVSRNDLYYFKPGQNFHYSNTGFNVLGKIIERASGKTYTEFLNDNFFAPLGLTNTFSVWRGDDVTIPEPKIESFLHMNGTVTNTTEDNMSANVSEGNIISSPSDAARWIHLLLTGQAGVNMSNIEKMMVMLPADPAHGVYGLGLTYTAGLGFGHNGAHICYLNILRYNPDNGITILISANFWDFPNILDQAESMIDFGLNAVEVIKE